MLKKILAFVLAGAMVIGTMSFTAFGAADGSTDNLQWNTTLTVDGLDNGDKVTYYKVLEWNQSADYEYIKDTNGRPLGWIWSDGVTYTQDATATPPTVDELTMLQTIVGTNDGSGQISQDTADKLAAAAGTAKGTGVAADGKWTVSSGVEPGLYMVIVEPITEGTLYNPIFVAANFYGDNETPDSANSIKISADELSYQPKARAKKSTIPLDKKAKGDSDTSNTLNDNDPDSVDVGEVVDFEVTTTIPKFSADYFGTEATQYPKFAMEDTLVGLKLDKNSINVYAGESASGTKLTENTDYTVSATDTSYTVTFTKSYLQNLNAAGQKIFITYKAEVSDTAEKIINQEKNTVTLKFSTKPGDYEGKGRKRDRTNHYTFSIDANLLGDDEVEQSSTEAIKVGRDAQGNPIMESKYYWDHKVIHPALEGAIFGLFKSVEGARAEDESDLYKNDVFTTGKVTSDAMGRLTIKGLDEGTYWLKELQAPEGFIRWQDPIEVKIEAEYSEPEAVEVTEDVDGVECTYYVKELTSYSVTVGGSETTYSIKHSVSEILKSMVKRQPGSSDKEIVNTKGVELPSTGGIGTTIFYAGGAMLVLLAGILLVSKRRVA